MPAGIIDSIYNEFFSPEAKERRIKLRQDQAAEKFYNSPEFLKMTGGVPIGGISGVSANLDNQKVAAAIASLQAQTTGQNLTNEGTKNTMGRTGGLPVDAARFFDIEKPESSANIQYKNAATRAEDAQTTQTGEVTKEMRDTTAKLGTTPQAFNAQTERNAAAGASAEHLGMLTQMFPDPKQQRVLLGVMKSAGYDTSSLEQAFAAAEADRKKKLDAILALSPDKNGTGSRTPSNGTGSSFFDRFNTLMAGHPKPDAGKEYVPQRQADGSIQFIQQDDPNSFVSKVKAYQSQDPRFQAEERARQAASLVAGMKDVQPFMDLMNRPIGSALSRTNTNEEDPISFLQRIIQQGQQ